MEDHNMKKEAVILIQSYYRMVMAITKRRLMKDIIVSLDSLNLDISHNDPTSKIIKEISLGKYKNIIIISGAGVSTNSGICDYRSKGSVFDQFQTKYGIPGHMIFSRDYVTTHPEIYYDEIYLNFKEKMLAAQPTPSHMLAKYLNDKGLLKRVYTQNVDGLYHKTGIDSDKIVEFHGNFADGSIVLYGDAIPSKCFMKLYEDFSEDITDLIIVMGTSLQVAPFCAIPNAVSDSCTRILVDIEPENAYSNSFCGASLLCNTKIAGRFVYMGSKWGEKKDNQHIVKMDCDEFSRKVMM